MFKADLENSETPPKQTTQAPGQCYNPLKNLGIIDISFFNDNNIFCSGILFEGFFKISIFFLKHH
jgi:hypothetical protein